MENTTQVQEQKSKCAFCPEPAHHALKEFEMCCVCFQMAVDHGADIELDLPAIEGGIMMMDRRERQRKRQLEKRKRRAERRKNVSSKEVIQPGALIGDAGLGSDAAGVR